MAANMHSIGAAGTRKRELLTRPEAGIRMQKIALTNKTETERGKEAVCHITTVPITAIAQKKSICASGKPVCQNQ